MMHDDYEKAAQDVKQEAKYTIISMDDGEDEEAKSILEEAKAEITRLYQEFSSWLKEHADSEETSKRLDTLKQDIQHILDTTKARLYAFQQREDVQTGKKKALAAAEKMGDVLYDGMQEVKRNEYVSKAVQTLNDTVERVKEDERVKENVKKIKKGTLKVAERAFNGLKRVLDTDDDDSRKG